VVRIGAATAAAVVALLAVPAAAQAHATLEKTSPERGARLAHAPSQVVFGFDESVNASLGGVKVFDNRGREVQAGAAFHPGGTGSQVAVRLAHGLPDGGYTATYHVISADSHPVSGGFTFTVGDGPAGAASVADLLKGQGAGPVTSVAFSAARALQYGAIAVALGTVVFLLVCWLPGLAAVAGGGREWREASAAFARRATVLLAAAAAMGLVSGIAGVLLQGAEGTGESLWSSLSGGVVRDVLATRFGAVWGAASVAWLLVAGWVLARPASLPTLRPASVGATGVALPRSRGGVALLAVPLGLLALLPALSGHPSVQSPVALLLPANVLHVVAMAAWLGGIAVLVLALRAATSRLAAQDRMPLLVAVVSRFSVMAGIAFAVLFATGVVQAIVEVADFGALLDTAFGRAVLIKLVLFGLLVVLGATNRRRLLPALRRSGASPARAGVLLRRTLRAELALGVSVLAVTGALAGYPPSTAVSSGPVTREADVGPAHMQLTLDPATTGPNEIHLYLFDHHTGAQFTRAKEVKATAALPAKGVAGLPLDLRTAGPGHLTGTGSLPVKGDWRLTVTVRVSDFDEYVAHLTVPVK
jgi:copper transport protein